MLPNHQVQTPVPIKITHCRTPLFPVQAQAGSSRVDRFQAPAAKSPHQQSLPRVQLRVWPGQSKAVLREENILQPIAIEIRHQNSKRR